MSGYDEPKNDHPKAPPPYEPPAQKPVVSAPSDEAPPAYQSTQAEPVLITPPPQDPPPAYAAVSDNPIRQDPPHPYDPPPPAYGSIAHDAGPAYERPPHEPSPGYGSPPNDSPPGRPRTNGPPRPPVPPPGASPPANIPPGHAAPYARLVSDISGFTTVPRQNLASSSAATQDGMLGTIATNAIQDVLGWQIRRSPDPNGFLNALKQSFSLKIFEGHVQSMWTPHTHVAQNDVAGGLAGAQASLCAMVDTILAQALPLIENLAPLKPEFDQEYVAVLKQIAKSQLSALGKEVSHLSGPRLMRVNQCFNVLMGVPIDANGVVTNPENQFWTDPDTVAGTFGNLRDAMGLGAVTSTYVNNLTDELNVTNFRCVIDYVNAILNSWLNSMQFFTTMQSPFLGTQLVWISMQLGVVNEAVEELRFVLDSVFIGEAERRTLVMSKLKGDDLKKDLPAITLSGLLSMIQSLVTHDGPDIIQTGGKFGIGEYFSVMVAQLREYVSAAIRFAQTQGFSALNTNRVLVALSKVERQLIELESTAGAVGIQSLPPPSAQPTVSQ
jgi:hypothetical protein